MIEIKADKQPIGIYIKEFPFTNHEFQLEKDDVIYIFSDGFTDQFGGENSQKFLMKRFKDLLLKIQKEGFQKQKEIINNVFYEWKGDNEQIDDIVIVSVKI